MIQPARLLVRLDAGPKGLGHAVRAKALLDGLKTPVTVTASGGGAGLETIFPGCVPWPVDIDDFDAVLVDLPEAADGPWAELRAFKGPVIAIDDFGGGIEADLVINGTVLPAYHRYPALRPGGRALCGPDHALIRPAFAAHPWRNPPDGGLAIVLGSGEAAFRWAHHLAGLRFPLPVTLVVGAAFPDFTAPSDWVMRRAVGAEALAELLAGSRAALMTGGMVIYEAQAVGVPSLVCPLLDNMVAEVAWFAERGAVVDLGPKGGGEVERIAERLAVNRPRPAGLIDGRGLERAARAVVEVLA